MITNLSLVLHNAHCLFFSFWFSRVSLKMSSMPPKYHFPFTLLLCLSFPFPSSSHFMEKLDAILTVCQLLTRSLNFTSILSSFLLMGEVALHQ